MTDDRLPAHLEVGGLIRAAESEGGFGMVLSKGEHTAGTLMVICCSRDTPARAYERMPQLDGSRKWTLAKVQDPENPFDFSEYCQRRGNQDPDLWVLELELENAERLLGIDPPTG
ncbi:DUF1491 family protein [Aurantiacibacter poecillastricola]|uniref:DUF1491 family protein n=1 Tax=Aurantiacibacter poecillastricola TaxID=3064385 RepID=UPI00273F4346|nr:DUF1491 family protein [Aurantiacibacter sp. 219JJ12-13]MDP5260515.1 DUF1491 family protein [Aurantiacibacter sp. 219JJ12-13]